MSAEGLPAELVEALAKAQAAADFASLPAAEQTQHVEWVRSCRTSDARAARALDVIRIAKWRAERLRRELKELGPSPWSKLS